MKTAITPMAADNRFSGTAAIRIISVGPNSITARIGLTDEIVVITATGGIGAKLEWVIEGPPPKDNEDEE